MLMIAKAVLTGILGLGVPEHSGFDRYTKDMGIKPLGMMGSFINPEGEDIIILDARYKIQFQSVLAGKGSSDALLPLA